MADTSGRVGVGINQPEQENKTGADFSGFNGQAGRILTLGYTPTNNVVLVVVDNVPLHITDGYTVSGTSLTIVGNLLNVSSVDIMYWRLP